MEFKTLENISVAAITSAFNEAFEGYFIPLKFTEETMASKIKSEGIRLEYSIGAFAGEKLVAFILHGYDFLDGVKTIYNAGTGVIPEYRGRNITMQLYQYCIPLLKGKGIHHHVLEVIDHNIPAIKVYRNVGFHEVRKLNAFKTSSSIETNSHCTCKEIITIPQDWEKLYEMAPAWQNSDVSIARDRPGHRIIGAYADDELTGFGAFVPSSGRVKQCLVLTKHRRKGIGKALFHYMYQNSATKQLVVTNIDEKYQPAADFLQAIGFHKFLTLHEMKMKVT